MNPSSQTIGSSASPSSENSQTRYHSLDGLRAAMMLLGLVLHVAVTYAPFDFSSVALLKDRQTHPIFDYVTFAIHVFRMPTFFVVAGFFAHLLAQRDGLKQMLLNRIRKVALPFLVMALPLSLAAWTATTWGLLRFDANSGQAILRALVDLKPIQPFDLHHLWFLYYLVIFHVVLAAVWGICRVFSLRKPYEALMSIAGSILRDVRFLPVFSLVTFAMFCATPSGFFPTYSEIWPLHFKSLFGYFVFFFFGWIMYRERDAIPTFARVGVVFCLLALIPLAINPYAILRMGEAAAAGAYREAENWRLLVAGTGALASSMLIYGLIGLFVRYLERPNRLIRYLADASYWTYLTHFPVVIFLSALMMPWNAPAFVKVGINLSSSMALLLVSYEFVVRRTFLGLFLTGRWGRDRPYATGRRLKA